MKIKATRRINENFNVIGRRFKQGDVVIFDGDQIKHIYINENNDGLEVLTTPQAQIKIEMIEIVLDNSEDV